MFVISTSRGTTAPSTKVRVIQNVQVDVMVLKHLDVNDALSMQHVVM